MVNVWDRPPAYYGLKGRDTIHIGTRYSTPAWLCLATEPDCPAARPALDSALDSHSGCNNDTRR